jgi:hypothetical protein
VRREQLALAALAAVVPRVVIMLGLRLLELKADE